MRTKSVKKNNGIELHDYQRVKRGIIRSYNRTYAKYLELFGNELEKYPSDKKLIDKFAERLPQQARVCDIGCGPSAYIGSYLLAKGLEVYGIDISDVCIRNAQELFPNMILHVMDMIDTEFRDDYFDGLVSFYSIYHIPKKYLQRVFVEFNRILKPKGEILLITHKGTFTGTLTELWGYDDLEMFATFHRENEIECLFAETGFTIDLLESKETVYEFPKERIIAVARKE